MDETVLHLDVKQSKGMKDDDPMLPAIYLDGLGQMFSKLGQRFSTCDDSLQWSEFSTAEDAHYVHAVMEAVRLASREKAWTKVNKKIPSPMVPQPSHLMQNNNLGARTKHGVKVEM